MKLKNQADYTFKLKNQADYTFKLKTQADYTLWFKVGQWVMKHVVLFVYL